MSVSFEDFRQCVRIPFAQSFRGIKLVDIISSAGFKRGSQSRKVSGIVDIFELPGDLKFYLNTSRLP